MLFHQLTIVILPLRLAAGRTIGVTGALEPRDGVCVTCCFGSSDDALGLGTGDAYHPFWPLFDRCVRHYCQQCVVKGALSFYRSDSLVQQAFVQKDLNADNNTGHSWDQLSPASSWTLM